MAAKLVNEESEENKDGLVPIDEGNASEVDKANASKFAEKSRDEVEQMLNQAQTMIGKQSEEVRDARLQIAAYQKADNFIQGQLDASKQEQPKEELDYFGNPEDAIQKSIESHPVVTETRDTLKELKQQQAAQQIMARHPDMVQVVQDQQFVNWVSQDAVRLRLFNEANNDLNVESAVYIFDEYKRQHQTESAPEQPKMKRSESVRAASSGAATGSSEPVSKKKYRASDIRRLKIDDPQAYADRSDEIMRAYAEGRVVRN
tara:strand:+ start:4830 stop:5609 length:780 start_codon:yes stop_codon:yes gene_type:complete